MIIERTILIFGWDNNRMATGPIRWWEGTSVISHQTLSSDPFFILFSPPFPSHTTRPPSPFLLSRARAHGRRRPPSISCSVWTPTAVASSAHAHAHSHSPLMVRLVFLVEGFAPDAARSQRSSRVLEYTWLLLSSFELHWWENQVDRRRQPPCLCKRTGEMTSVVGTVYCL